MDRSKAPGYKEIKAINIARPDTGKLDNGIPLYIVKSPIHDIVKITLLFNAGSIYQPAPLVAFCANSLLMEGTRQYTSAQISEMNDFYGSQISCNTDKDFASISLLVLRKHLENILPLLNEITRFPVYPETELATFIQRHKQQFIIEQSRNQNIAHKKFVRTLFGNNHPYGYELTIEDFQLLTVDKINTFYKTYYHPGNCKIVISGNIHDKDIGIINQYFGTGDWTTLPQAPIPDHQLSGDAQYKHHINKPGSVQSSVRIGKQICNKLNPDHAGLTVVNTILGGYFGSRLMQNIREDKGYTYGVASLLVSLKHAGYITIITDVGKEVTQAAINEIYKEITRLKEEIIPEQELKLVRTHLLSDMLRSFDGPFAQAESLVALLEYDLDYDYYEHYLESINNIHPEEIRKLSQQYLDFQRIYEIVVG